MVKKGLVEPGFLGIKAFPIGSPNFQHWWQWVLVAIIAISGVIGLSACLWYSLRSIIGLLKVSTSDQLLLQATDYARSNSSATMLILCHDQSKNVSISSLGARTNSARSTYLLRSLFHLVSTWE
jgi:hypothetical protein